MSNSGRRASVRCPPPGHHQKKEPAVRRSAIALRTPAYAFVANLATSAPPPQRDLPIRFLQLRSETPAMRQPAALWLAAAPARAGEVGLDFPR
jgi:hypothetical protein